MNRIWMGVGALIVGGLFWAVGQAVNPSSGDTEMKKMLEATKQVKSFRGSSSAAGSERLWEVDCNRVIVHQHSGSSSDSSFGGREDELLVGDVRYSRQGSGGWDNNGEAGPRGSAKWYCDNIARGTVRDLLPDMYAMIGHAMFETGDKKTVNGVRCQDFKFAMQSVLNAERGSICIGLDDHLPYELTSQGGGRYTYSDYGRAIEFDAPDAVLQAARSTSPGN